MIGTNVHDPVSASSLPGEGLQAHQMPGHWLLARLGKRVLRPGGSALSGRMIEALNIGPSDDVVEFAPGLGATARLVLRRGPRSYKAVERDPDAAALVSKYLHGANQQVVVGVAEATGLPAESASVVYGEAMLTMQPVPRKCQIIAEANRLLRADGRYAIHEMCLLPEGIAGFRRRAIQADLSAVTHHIVRPLTAGEWRDALRAAGFEIEAEAQSPMHLLEPRRMLRDEGLLGTLRILFNLLRDREARRRVVEMRRTMRRYAAHLGAIVLVGRKIGGLTA